MRDRYELLPDRQRNANGTKMLIARRLVERGVRFVQVTTGGWDTHFDLAKAVRGSATNTDRAAAALLADLKERGLLDSTLVIWGGEFGRTPTAQPTTSVPGRDHNGKSMMAWMAGGGVKAGTVVGTPYANDRKEDGDYSVISICFKVSEVDAMAAKLTSEDKK